MSDAKADCTALKDLLMWCRDNGMKMDAVTVGSVSVSVVDLKQGEKLARKALNADPSPIADAYRQWGGEAISDLLTKDGGALIEDDDEVPPG